MINTSAKPLFSLGLLLMAWALFLPLSFAAAPSRILVVHSYHQGQEEHVVEMTKGIEEALVGAECEIRYFHMDTKRHNTQEWKQEAGRKARQLVAEYRPQVVITMDDNAQEYFAKGYAGAPAPPIFVFSGVNGEPRDYGFPANNVTGVLERPNILESIELLKKIRPEVKTLLVLTDKSKTTDAFIEYCKSLNLPVTVKAYEQPLTFEDWKAVVAKYYDQVDAIGLYVIRTITRSASDPTQVPEQELVKYLNTRYKIPTVGFFDTAAKAGILCGISVSMWEQGYAAAWIARKILTGAKPNDFAVKPTKKGRIQLNLQTAERLGIELPYGMIKRADVVVR